MKRAYAHKPVPPTPPPVTFPLNAPNFHKKETATTHRKIKSAPCPLCLVLREIDEVGLINTDIYFQAITFVIT